MKRDLFSWVFAVLIWVILLGWLWLPESAVFIKKYPADEFTTFFKYYGTISLTIFSSLSFYALFKIGNKLYDYLRK